MDKQAKKITLSATLTPQVVESAYNNMSKEAGERWRKRQEAGEARSVVLDSLTSHEQVDRLELVFSTVLAWVKLSKEDKKDYSRSTCIAAVADHMGDRSPKTLTSWAKLTKLGTVEMAVSQVDKLGLQCAIDTTCKVGAITERKTATHCYEMLTNTTQSCTRYFKRWAEECQAQGKGLIEAIELFNGMDQEQLEKLYKTPDKVDRALYDLAVAENVKLKAELKALREGMVPNGVEASNGAPVAA